MKKNMIFAAIAALALTACSNDDEIKVGGDNAILLTSSLNVAETRAATDIQTSAFDAGENVDVYITEHNGGNNPTTYPQPIEYSTAAGGALTVGTQYYYPTSGNGVNIYALYPATAATSQSRQPQHQRRGHTVHPLALKGDHQPHSWCKCHLARRC